MRKRLDDTSKISCLIRLKIALLVMLLHCCFSFAGAQQMFVLSGKITDASTGEPLAAANVRIAGTSRGTIANTQGWYALTVEPGERAIIYSYLGYEPETLRTVIRENIVHNVRLKPSPIQLPEEIVVAEDPAITIIRKAIANKRKWMDRLKSYSFEAFVRQVLRRDTSIASIMEAYTTGYMLVGDTLREVVKQKRQTENVPLEGNLAAVRRIVNFNEDEIRLLTVRIQESSSSYTFIGPTAPDALDYYDYKLLSTSNVASVEVYRIAMTPKTRLRPLFEGTFTIADETFAVMGIDLKPNETFNIPFTKELELRYRQEFALYDSIFWMPTNIRVTGGVSLSFIGITMPRVGIDIASTLYDYAINLPIPDSILQKPRLTVDSTAAVFDSTFWKENEVLPLTNEEEIAYHTLDTTQTLEKQFQPRGVLVSFGDNGGSSFSALKYIDARFNRVEGFFFGGKLELDSLVQFAEFNASAGYGFSDNIFKYTLGSTVFTTSKRSLGVGGELYHTLGYIPDGEYYGPLFNSLTSLIDKTDYRDYYFANGWRAYVRTQPSNRSRTELSFVNERHTSMSNTTDFSLFSRHLPFLPNPAIAEGRLRSMRFDLHLGPPKVLFALVTQNTLDIALEYSSPSLANSTFDFLQYSIRLQWHVKTFSQSMLFPQTLRLSLNAGAGGGSLPAQRMFVLDSRASFYAPFGVLKGSKVREFVGDKFIMLNLEHNFRSVSFLALDIPSLYRNNIELILHGSIAQMWLGDRSLTKGWYTEAGIGISRIFEIVRADITYRFRDPERLHFTKRLYFTLSVASIF